MRTGVLLHRDTGVGSAIARMIGTSCVGCPYREVERTDSGHDSYETAHVGLIISVRLLLM
jgi:hypothetical protein